MKFENHHFIIGNLFNIEKFIENRNFFSSLMPERTLSSDGKKHVVTVPVRLRKMQNITSPPKHEG